MSGTIIPGQPLIVSQPVNRQTIPYGDRPLVEVRNGKGYLTQWGYQFLTRLGQGLDASIVNVGSIIEVTNTVVADLSTIEAEIGTLFADIGSIEAEISAGLAGIPPFPQPPPPQPLQQTPPPAAMPPLPSAAPLWPSSAPVMVTALPPPEPVRAPPASVAWQEIASVTVSGASSQVFVLPANFQRFQLIMQGITVGTSAAVIEARFSTDAGATFISTASYATVGTYLLGTTTTNYNVAASACFLTRPLSTGGSFVAEGTFDLFPGSAAVAAMFNGVSTGNTSVGPGWYLGQFSNINVTGAAVNAFQVFPSAGVFSGQLVLLGLA